MLYGLLMDVTYPTPYVMLRATVTSCWPFSTPHVTFVPSLMDNPSSLNGVISFWSL